MRSRDIRVERSNAAFPVRLDRTRSTLRFQPNRREGTALTERLFQRFLSNRGNHVRIQNPKGFVAEKTLQGTQGTARSQDLPLLDGDVQLGGIQIGSLPLIQVTHHFFRVRVDIHRDLLDAPRLQPAQGVLK